ncbi:hypothetical protein Syun_014634 [Stephania yunnanensis]|uniref:Heat shock protein 70 n=1 Tax=Stephania yunnanensis TaxID=152371 RepID=A0AAP0JK65_9MAGN
MFHQDPLEAAAAYTTSWPHFIRKIIGSVCSKRLVKNQIDEIVLVSGSTRIRKVQPFLKDYFDGKEPNKGVNLDEAVAYGGVVQGNVFSGEGGEDHSTDSL